MQRDVTRRMRFKMRINTLINRLLNIKETVVEEVYFDTYREEEILVIRVRPYKRQKHRCPQCGEKCSGYDKGGNLRRWRSMDFGGMRVYIEAYAPRVKCKEHGVVVASVPWAEHDTEYTRDFEMAVTWFTLHATITDVSEYFRVKWDTVGSIVRRVQNRIDKGQPSRFENLEEIGIDETSYKKGHKYMTVVVDHKSGQLIWAKKGHGKEVLSGFFRELTEEQRAKIKYVSADGARWIAACIQEFCPNAERCIDPFHVVAWANDVLDDVRKATVRTAKQEAAAGRKAEPSQKKRTQSLRDTPY